MLLKGALNPGETLIAAASMRLPAWMGGRGRSVSGLRGRGCSGTAQDGPFAVSQLTGDRGMDLKAKYESNNTYSWGFFEGKQGKLSLCKGLKKPYILHHMCESCVAAQGCVSPAEPSAGMLPGENTLQKEYSTS